MTDPHSSRFRLAVVLVSMGLVATAACSSDKSSSPASVTGTYTLRQVDDAPIPVVYYEDPLDPQYVERTSGGTLTLRDDGTFHLDVAYDSVSHGNQGSLDANDVFDGTWTQSGTSLTFTETGSGETLDGILSPNVIRLTPVDLDLDDQVDTLVFRK